MRSRFLLQLSERGFQNDEQNNKLINIVHKGHVEIKNIRCGVLRFLLDYQV